MYVLLAVSLAFALLLALNILASAAASILWRAASPLVKHRSAKAQARFIFALRVFPFAGALVFVVAFLLPAYFLFEPHSSEAVSVKLALLASASAIGAALAAYRLFGTWWRTRRLAADWLARAETVSIADVKIPIYRISHQFPVIAVVGTFRPRLFVARQIFDSLDAEEFRAAIAHEHGHLVSGDNFKRAILRVCSDLLVVPFARSLDRVWAENAESAADEYAARIGGQSAAVNLASALVKIARIAPRGARPAMPSGAFLIEPQNTDVAWRVRRLLRLSETGFIPAKYRLLEPNYLFWFYLSGIVAAVLLLATNYDFLLKIHLALEAIVAILQ